MTASEAQQKFDTVSSEYKNLDEQIELLKRRLNELYRARECWGNLAKLLLQVELGTVPEEIPY